MDILTWVIFGAIAGTVANLIDPAPSRGGILGSIVLGIVGAIIGGFLSNMVFGIGVTGFNLSSFIVAIVGSLIVLWGAHALSRRAV